MKHILIAVVITTFHCCHGAETTSPAPDIAAMVIKAKVEGFSQALVELKLEEFRLTSATPVDNAKLSAVRAQEALINEELLKMTIAPLNTKLEEALKSYTEGHRVVIGIRKEIEQKTAEIRNTLP